MAPKCVILEKPPCTRTNENGSVLETCNGTLPVSYPVIKLQVSDFFGWKSFNSYLLFAVAIFVVTGVIVGSVGLYVYFENRQIRNNRFEMKTRIKRFNESPTTMNLLGNSGDFSPEDSSQNSPENGRNSNLRSVEIM